MFKLFPRYSTKKRSPKIRDFFFCVEADENNASRRVGQLRKKHIARRSCEGLARRFAEEPPLDIGNL